MCLQRRYMDEEPLDLFPPNFHILHDTTSPLLVGPGGQAAVAAPPPAANPSPSPVAQNQQQQPGWSMTVQGSQTRLLAVAGGQTPNAGASSLNVASASEVVASTVPVFAATPSLPILSSFNSQPSAAEPTHSALTIPPSPAVTSSAIVSTAPSSSPPASSVSVSPSVTSHSETTSTSNSMALTTTTSTSPSSALQISSSSNTNNPSSALAPSPSFNDSPFLSGGAGSPAHNPPFLVGIVLGTMVALAVLAGGVTWVMKTHRSKFRGEIMPELGYGYGSFGTRKRRDSDDSDGSLEEKKGPGMELDAPHRIRTLRMSFPTSQSCSSLPPAELRAPSYDFQLPPIPTSTSMTPESNRTSMHLQVMNLMPGDVSSSETVNRAGIGAGHHAAGSPTFSPPAYPQSVVGHGVAQTLPASGSLRSLPRSRQSTRHSLRSVSFPLSQPVPAAYGQDRSYEDAPPPVPEKFMVVNGEPEKLREWATTAWTKGASAFKSFVTSNQQTATGPPPLTSFPERRVSRNLMLPSMRSDTGLNHRSSLTESMTSSKSMSYKELTEGESIRFDDAHKLPAVAPAAPMFYESLTARAPIHPDLHASMDEVQAYQRETNDAPIRSDSLSSYSSQGSGLVAKRNIGPSPLERMRNSLLVESESESEADSGVSDERIGKTKSRIAVGAFRKSMGG